MYKHIDSLIFGCLLFLVFSCQKKTTLQQVIPYSNNYKFKHTKTIRDIRNNFEITIGNHWKRELYFDDFQSRIYAADTTKSFSSSFIVDITRFKGKLFINNTFLEQISTNLLQQPSHYLLQQKTITFKNKPAMAIFSFKKTSNGATYFLDCYVADNEAHYLLKAQINGSNALVKNCSEILQIFNSLTFLP